MVCIIKRFRQNFEAVTTFCQKYLALDEVNEIHTTNMLTNVLYVLTMFMLSITTLNAKLKFKNHLGTYR